jgi:FkbM family methyltransferase
MSLFFRSVQLDFAFLQLDFSTSQKFSFLLQKYLTLGKEIFFRTFIHEHVAHAFGKKYYYDDKYGLAILQSTFIDNSFLKKFIKPNSIVIDVGANIGQFNLFTRHYLQAKRVYSFEPIKTTYTLLSKNCEKDVYNFAISAKQKLVFYLTDLSVWASSLKQENTKRTESVAGIKLDTFTPLKKEKVVDLFKIDTEGAEMGVLQVSKTIIKKSRYILVEVSFVRESDSKLYETMTFLRRIVPDIELVRIGHVYNNNDLGVTGAADILFYNPAYKK